MKPFSWQEITFVIVLVPPKAIPETRPCPEVLYLGSYPGKPKWRSEDNEREWGKTAEGMSISGQLLSSAGTQSPWRVPEKPFWLMGCCGIYSLTLALLVQGGLRVCTAAHLLTALTCGRAGSLTAQRGRCLRWDAVIVLETASTAAELRGMLRG